MFQHLKPWFLSLSDHVLKIISDSLLFIGRLVNEEDSGWEQGLLVVLPVGGPNELLWGGDTTWFCDVLAPCEHLSFSSFNWITFKIPQQNSWLMVESGQELASLA